MNILITGGLGYIGSHTVIECINSKHSVVIVDNLYNSSIKVLEKLNKFLNKDLKFYKKYIIQNMVKKYFSYF